MTDWRRANFQTSLERNYSSPLVCSINQRQVVVVVFVFLSQHHGTYCANGKEPACQSRKHET